MGLTGGGFDLTLGLGDFFTSSTSSSLSFSTSAGTAFTTALSVVASTVAASVLTGTSLFRGLAVVFSVLCAGASGDGGAMVRVGGGGRGMVGGGGINLVSGRFTLFTLTFSLGAATGATNLTSSALIGGCGLECGGSGLVRDVIVREGGGEGGRRRGLCGSRALVVFRRLNGLSVGCARRGDGAVGVAAGVVCVRGGVCEMGDVE